MPGTMATNSPTPSTLWSEWGPVLTGEGNSGHGSPPSNPCNPLSANISWGIQGWVLGLWCQSGEHLLCTQQVTLASLCTAVCQALVMHLAF